MVTPRSDTLVAPTAGQPTATHQPAGTGPGIAVTLTKAIIGGVLAGFASFFVHLVRRARLAEVAGAAEVEHAGLGGPA